MTQECAPSSPAESRAHVAEHRAPQVDSASIVAPAETASLPRRVVAEAVASMLLLVVLTGSGIEAERLARPNVGLALLCNGLATACGLWALLRAFEGVSGPHLNPITSWLAVLERRLGARDAAAYTLAQVVGSIAGVACVHALFGREWPSPHEVSVARAGLRMLLSEATATFGLYAVVRATLQTRPADVHAVVATYVVGAYWCTPSNAFLNPAGTIARATTDTFVGVRTGDVGWLLGGQVLGAIVAAALTRWMFGAFATQRR